MQEGARELALVECSAELLALNRPRLARPSATPFGLAVAGRSNKWLMVAQVWSPARSTYKFGWWWINALSYERRIVVPLKMLLLLFYEGGLVGPGTATSWPPSRPTWHIHNI